MDEFILRESLSFYLIPQTTLLVFFKYGRELFSENKELLGNYRGGGGGGERRSH